MKKTVGEVVSMLDSTIHTDAFRDVVITGICFDTRQIKPGDLFVPFVGELRDGHEFVGQAREMGAVATFWQKNVPNPPTDFPVILVEDTLLALQEMAKKYIQEVKPKVIAITGSNGKTTTKDIMAAIVETSYKVHYTGGNFNNHIGLPYTILTMPEDTEVAVLEMGMNHRHEIEVLSKIAKPDIAIITNIGEAHIEYLGSREEIAKAKLEITAGLSPSGILIYPYEEALLLSHIDGDFRQLTFGKSQEAEIYPLAIHAEAEGTAFVTNWEPDLEIFVPIIGEHNVFNAMATMLAAREIGIEGEKIQKALRNMERSKSRLEWLTTKNGTRILNDAYNSSPTALKTVLKTFMHMDSQGKRKYLVLADMLELGELSAQLHKESAEVLEEGAVEKVFLYGEAMKAFEEVAKIKIGQRKVQHFDTKESLETALLNEMDGNEWILVKGSYGMGLKDVVENLIIK
ncbi:UDP-N-acetylmuramoyl-tripeptide--D-alanyl-D-alanine ligase [Listeria ivanovii subsp. londoniensis]|uniref:UDP-N-acetylmuramoyl-tripeptide--D-alanyl-D- alanine ligase n=1 Tax=Listeria ivanovii TaxID=1638 RepID=UPI001906552B|nr:UDP-N-acetylmuramoyl-tripeptide--D-alanyl-D-alanine ligase [Listeria ivanovii]MBK2002254.1 UDP-N-acetylmuramoyl-tripeptide--D-alanyl-D-alanine ligase [Listeria ivanovii subsp. londoniensis]